MTHHVDLELAAAETDAFDDLLHLDHETLQTSLAFEVAVDG